MFEIDSSDNYIWNVQGINLISRQINGEMFYCMYNAHADITRMVDENGELAEKYYYDEWCVETETLKYGDVNCDGEVDLSDYSSLKSFILQETEKLTKEQQIVSDVNGDGTVNMTDANLLKFSVLHPESVNFPADTNKDGFINEKNDIKYAGYFYDAETGLYYLNARFYDPETARFIQQDSYSGDIFDPLSLNLYTYAQNNPISYYDPTGHSIKSLLKKAKETVNKAKETVKSAFNNTVKAAKQTVQKAKQTVTKAANEYKENWNSGISQLKSSGPVGKAFAAYSEGAVNSLNNMGKGVAKFANDPMGTVSESVNYFLEDPVRNNPIAEIVRSQQEIQTAIMRLDYETVAYKIGGLSSDIAVAGITGGAAKGIAGKLSGKFLPEGIHINKTLEFNNPFSPQYAFAGAPAVSAGAVSVSISINASSEAVAKAFGYAAGGVVTATTAQNIVYSKTLSGQSSGGESSQGSNNTGRMAMVNKVHPVTGVKFDEKGFPIFDSKFDMHLEKTDYLKSRGTHFSRASKALYEKIQNDQDFAALFTQNEIEIFKAGGVPKKYTWHHNQEPGLMQLVDRDIHKQTGHDGGFSIWGPGNK